MGKSSPRGGARVGSDRGSWAEESLAAVLYHATHDLRSPLSAILNYVELLEEDVKKGATPPSEILERVRRSAGNALAWLDRLTPLARLGRAPFRSESVDLDLLARSAAEQHARGKEASTAFEIGPLGSIRGDPQILECVFASLLEWLSECGGSESGTPAGFGTLRREPSETGDAAEFSVEIGALEVPAERAGEVLLPFSAASRKRSQAPDLKLAVVAWGILRHRGQVWVEPSASCLRFSLPTSPGGEE